LDPFKIITQVNPVCYCLEIPPIMHIHPVFHVSLLEPYKTSQIPSRILPPPLPFEIDHDVEYEIEEILNSCLRHRRVEYFIHWKGYGISERTLHPTTRMP
jgi:hypothetical protein